MKESKVDIWKRKIRNKKRKEEERILRILKYGTDKPWVKPVRTSTVNSWSFSDAYISHDEKYG